LNEFNVKNELDDSAKSKILHRINQGEPYQYVINQSWFYGMELSVNEHVLIPRPETEELVDYLIKHVPSNSVIDLGTGSGCIALALKKGLPQVKILGVDLSSEALDVAKKNAQKLDLDIEFKHDDMLNPTQTYSDYDLIVSNPPYIEASEQLDETVQQYEPHMALFSPDDALKFYRAVLSFASEHLRAGGTVAVEINQELGKETLALFVDYQAEMLQDMSGNDRFIIAHK
jgi:release factor glutamine methyltransferase